MQIYTILLGFQVMVSFFSMFYTFAAFDWVLSKVACVMTGLTNNIVVHFSLFMSNTYSSTMQITVFSK
jgi:hypothetical protein